MRVWAFSRLDFSLYKASCSPSVVSTENQSHSSTFTLPNTIKLLKGLFSSSASWLPLFAWLLSDQVTQKLASASRNKAAQHIGVSFLPIHSLKISAPQLPALLVATKSNCCFASPRRLQKLYLESLPVGSSLLNFPTFLPTPLTNEKRLENKSRVNVGLTLSSFPPCINLGPSSPGCLGSFPIPSNRFLGFLYLAFLVVLSWSESAICQLTISGYALFSNYIFI